MQPPRLPSEGKWTIARVCDACLVDLHRTASPDWARQVQGWLNDLCGYCGALEVSEFKRRHLRNWLAGHSNWSDNTKRNVIGSVKVAFNFCVKDGDIDVNPVAGYEKPTQVPRVTAFSPEDLATRLGSRAVPVTPGPSVEAHELRPRFLGLRRKLELPADRCMYTCRHTFAKRTLAGYYTGKPVTIEVLAGLMGNTRRSGTTGGMAAAVAADRLARVPTCVSLA